MLPLGPTYTPLTPLGRHLAALPLEPRVGKALLLGKLFGVLSPALTIAAAADRPPFVRPFAAMIRDGAMPKLPEPPALPSYGTGPYRVQLDARLSYASTNSCHLRSRWPQRSPGLRPFPLRLGR